MGFTRSKFIIRRDGNNAAVDSIERYWNIGPKPWREQREFRLVHAYYTNFSGYYYDAPGNRVDRVPVDVGNWASAGPSQQDSDAALNKAYGKFTDAAKDSAQNANNALEGKQAFSSIATKVTAIAKAFTACKKGDVRGAAKALGVTVSGNLEKKIKKRAKQASDIFLELHFGWIPLVQDIGSSIDIAQGTGKSGNGGSHTKQRVTSTHGIAGSSWTSLANGSYINGYEAWHWNVSTKMSANVEVTNPNFALANQMGFVNPLSVAWEAVPFSFVVDWFANVGQCISAMTDFVGFSITDARTTQKWTVTHEYNQYSYGNVNWNIDSQTNVTSVYFLFTRSPGIRGPVLQVKPFHGFSPTRAATAISLLVQHFKT